MSNQEQEAVNTQNSTSLSRAERATPPSLIARSTPGPWTVGVEPTLNTIRIRDNDLDVLPIATLFYSDGGKPRYQRDEAIANARLIAAAPDLLDFAAECARADSDCGPSIREAARAAIAKAAPSGGKGGE